MDLRSKSIRKSEGEKYKVQEIVSVGGYGYYAWIGKEFLNMIPEHK